MCGDEEYGEHREHREHRERGQASVLIVGFAVVLLLLIAVVIDSSAAFRHRQGLTNLADGAALFGADAGAAGREVYGGGIDQQPLDVTTRAARAGVARYLHAVGAYREHPGLSYQVSVREDVVVVTVSAPVDLPLTFPGLDDRPRVSAHSSAVIDPDG